MSNRPLVLALLLALPHLAIAQFATEDVDRIWMGNPDILLTNMQVQVDVTQAVQDLYNFKFDRAEKQFRWLRQSHPEHPLPYFLLGLSEWWKIVPNTDDEQYDERFLDFMEQSIDKAEAILDRDEDNPEAHFFLAAAYGFQGRLYSERSQWRKATFSSKRALNHMQASKDKAELSPEFLFGDGLYNYYREWIPENFFWLRPVVALFPDGDREKGLAQLSEVTRDAFYTRTEAQYFLMQIYNGEENRPDLAFPIAQELNEDFPDNAAFQRYYARMCFQRGLLDETERVSREMMDKIDRGMPGYEGVSGRYAAFYLGHIHRYRYRDQEKAKGYFEQALAFAESTDDEEMGYYLHSLANLARIANQEGDVASAQGYYRRIKKHAERKHSTHEEAREYLRKH
ncbi:MAG: tol-pal system protein YbgF [Catalinimonas sp.]